MKNTWTHEDTQELINSKNKLLELNCSLRELNYSTIVNYQVVQGEKTQYGDLIKETHLPNADKFNHVIINGEYYSFLSSVDQYYFFDRVDQFNRRVFSYFTDSQGHPFINTGAYNFHPIYRCDQYQELLGTWHRNLLREQSTKHRIKSVNSFEHNWRTDKRFNHYISSLHH